MGKGPLTSTELSTVKVFPMLRSFSFFFSSLIVWGFFFFSGVAVASKPPSPVHRVWVLPLSGAVTPPMASFLHRWFRLAEQRAPSLIVLRVDTPGGLSGPMRAIIKDILSSRVPIAGYVAPGGARAASAGTYILYACPIAAMADGTNIGSATPIPVGGSLPLLPAPSSPVREKGAREHSPNSADTEERKIVNDAVAYIRSLAEINGRNPDWAARAVESAANLSAREALKNGVIDLIAPDIPGLLRSLDGHPIDVRGEKIVLRLEPFTIRMIHPGWKDRLLEILARPEMAYLLFLLGIVGLAFEFSHPGFVLPGITGLLSLVLAFYAFTLLPVSLTGLILLILGISLMIAEVLVGAFGGLAVAGILSFFLGSLFFFRGTGGAGAPLGSHPMALIFSFTLLVSAFFLGVVRLALKARLRPVLTGLEGLKGETGIALDSFQKKGRIRLHSEIWWATSPIPVREGEAVTVEGIAGLTLTVRPDREEVP